LEVDLPAHSSLVIWNITPSDNSLKLITNKFRHINELTLFDCTLKPATGFEIANNMTDLTILRLANNEIGD